MARSKNNSKKGCLWWLFIGWWWWIVDVCISIIKSISKPRSDAVKSSRHNNDPIKNKSGKVSATNPPEISDISESLSPAAPTYVKIPRGSFKEIPKPSRQYKWKSGDFKKAADTKDYCVLDVETTGLDYYDDRIIEIAIVRTYQDRIVDVFDTFVNPGIAVPERITALTGISNSDIEPAPSYSEIAPKIYDLLNNTTVIGHNVTFDLNFIQQLFTLLPSDIDISMDYIDTWDYARRVVDGLPNYKLQSLLAFFNIDPGDAHRAIDDAKATQKLFVALKNYQQNKRETELQAKREAKAEAEAARHEKYGNSPLLDISFCFTGEFSVERAELFDMVKSVGALPREKVSKKTNYLVVGDISDLPDWAIQRKKGEAEEIQANGGSIQIIDEADFFKMIDDARSVVN